MCSNLNIVVLWTVIVNDNLLSLPVALTRRENDGPSTFEHRNEVGNDDGLCKQIFGSGKEFRTLPSPLGGLLVVVTAMTGPEREMAVLQSVRWTEWSRDVLYPRLAIVVDVTPKTRLVGILRETIGNQFLNGHTVNNDTYLIFIIGLG